MAGQNEQVVMRLLRVIGTETALEELEKLEGTTEVTMKQVNSAVERVEAESSLQEPIGSPPFEAGDESEEEGSDAE